MSLVVNNLFGSKRPPKEHKDGDEGKGQDSGSQKPDELLGRHHLVLPQSRLQDVLHFLVVAVGSSEDATVVRTSEGVHSLQMRSSICLRLVDIGLTVFLNNLQIKQVTRKNGKEKISRPRNVAKHQIQSPAN